MLFIILFLHQTTTSQAASLADIYVVYHLVPTSNHNATPSTHWIEGVVYHLVPTSNHNFKQDSLLNRLRCLSSCSYIKPQPDRHNLHQLPGCLSSCSYIKPQRYLIILRSAASCLSSCSYIKPQPRFRFLFFRPVVYHLVPTSNHNSDSWLSREDMSCLSSCSYIKPQLISYGNTSCYGCLSSCSYIKPQPIATNLLVISKILRFELLRNGRAGRILLQIY